MRGLRYLALGALLMLGGCQDSALDLSSATAPKVAVGPSVPVAVQSIEGLPTEIAPRFSSALASEAQARQISFADGPQAPRFRLKGYLDASQGEGGTVVTWVWDVFDARSSRAQRISGSQRVGASSASPWSVVDDKALRYVAARSLDDVGVFLMAYRSATPATASPAAAPVAAPAGKPAPKPKMDEAEDLVGSGAE